MPLTLYKWTYTDSCRVELDEVPARNHQVRDGDIIVPLTPLSVALGEFTEMTNQGQSADADRIFSVRDSDFPDPELDDLIRMYPGARFMWISDVIMNYRNGKDTWQFDFRNMNQGQECKLLASWSGWRRDNSALVCATLVDGKTREKTDVGTATPAYLIWYSGGGRFEYFFSEQDRGYDTSWYPEFIATMLSFVDIQEDVEEWDEHFIEMETLYHYRDFLKSFRGDRGIPPEVVLEICKTFQVSTGDLARALAHSLAK